MTALSHPAGVVIGIGLAMGVLVPGCASTPRTRIDPARTEAGEVVQRPGAVERLVVTISPGPAPAGAAPDATLSDAAIKAMSIEQLEAAYVTNVGNREGIRHELERRQPRRKSSPQGAAPQPEAGSSLDQTLRAAVEAARESGSTVTIDWSRQVDASADTRTLEDRGPGLESRGAEQATDLNQRDRRLPMPWGGESRGGGWGLESSIVGGGGANVLHWLGGLFVLASVVPIVIKPRRIDAAAAMLGAGLIVIAAGTVHAEYPWVLAVALVAVLGVLAWLGYLAWSSNRKAKAIEPLAETIENAPNADDLKARIAEAAGDSLDQVRAEVRKVKKRLVKRGAIKPAKSKT